MPKFQVPKNANTSAIVAQCAAITHWRERPVYSVTHITPLARKAGVQRDPRHPTSVKGQCTAGPP